MHECIIHSLHAEKHFSLVCICVPRVQPSCSFSNRICISGRTFQVCEDHAVTFAHEYKVSSDDEEDEEEQIVEEADEPADEDSDDDDFNPNKTKKYQSLADTVAIIHN